MNSINMGRGQRSITRPVSKGFITHLSIRKQKNRQLPEEDHHARKKHSSLLKASLYDWSLVSIMEI
jgi:hypothetical protein